MTHLWIGTYPAAGSGTPVGLGEGIWRVRLDDDGTLHDAVQVATTPSPSFVAAHPNGRVLYAVNEHTAGTVTAFAVADDGTLTQQAQTPSGGDDPCHVLLDADARTLLVANYSSGTLAAFPLAEDGALTGSSRVFAHTGSGPREDRQEGPHAHFVALDPAGEHVLVVDLGTDQIRRYRRTPDGLAEDGIAASFPPGTGPRHVAFGGGFAYVVGELDATLHVLSWKNAEGVALQTAPLPAGLPSHVTLDGDRLLVGARGADVIARFRVADDGMVAPIAEDDLPGSWPRHHLVVGGRTVVAEQIGGAVTVLAADGSVVDRLPLPAAACIARVV
ncbi:lactonase family protein [Cellulomonas sp. JH27-2]|uniref:lactonase family protein n=1 Tax=Cellulomonas sp. JH27-2 TaxID=2774139 RepID=UPI0017846509|nr:lactonase family protein [Cellulomonas sp. JH27-2]